MEIKGLFDQDTFTITYVAFDKSTKEAVIIDPVLNYEPHASKITYNSLEQIKSYITKENLIPKYILETHAHADHISASQELKKIYPNALLGIGKDITKVQSTFKDIFNLKSLPTDGSQFDLLLSEENKLNLGNHKISIIETPGHTPACVSYLIADNVFTGDALFMPDFGTGRCDFPQGSAQDLYESIHTKLYKLPNETKVFVGHDYRAGGRELKFETTIGESKEKNIQLKAATTSEEYIKFRTTRDAKLKAPKLLLQSVQVNIAAGVLPTEEDNGVSYLKFPLSK